MRLLAIDASTTSSGWAIFEDKELKDYGCLTASSTDVIVRIKKIILELNSLLKEYTIDKILMEEVRPELSVQNIKTHKALMYLQAAIIFLIHENYKNIPIDFVYPSEWRKKCGIKTGSGVSRSIVKQADIDFVKNKYHIDVNDDIADAIGIGYGYIHEEKTGEINWG